MGIREKFVERFGEADAKAIEGAANSHKNGIHDKPGSDPFRWAIAICIGFDCLERFRGYHGIAASTDDLREWIVEHGGLAKHDGDVDYISLFAGTYEKWMQPRPVNTEVA